MKVGNIEIGRKAIRKRTPTFLKKIGDSCLTFATMLQAYTMIVMSDPATMKMLAAYVPEKYTQIATLVCVLIKIGTMFTGRPNEKPIYPKNIKPNDKTTERDQ